ncbi:MAG: hypothetical protein K2K53_05180 [Oscillospiraceae bacterium]|nr:hypothetical protein [Oscillospiraceae bacterium]
MADSYRYDPDNQGTQGTQGTQGSPGPNQQGYNYHYKYSYGSGSGRGTAPSGGRRPPQQDNGIGDWIGMAVLFLLPTAGITQIIAVIWLVRKLMRMDAAQKQRYREEAQRAASNARSTVADLLNMGSQMVGGMGRQQGYAPRQDAQGPAAGYQYGQQQAAQPQQPKAEPWTRKAQPDSWNVRDPAETRRQKAQRQARKESASGKGLIIGGGILSAIFALGTAAVSLEFLRDLIRGYYWPDDFIGVLACMMFLAGGLAMLFSGVNMNRRSERYMNYLAYIGANREVPLAHMAATFGISVHGLCKDLRRMLAKGILPTGYLDLAEGKLYLTEMGYRAPEPKREAPPKEETPQEAAAREDDILREIQQVNDEIPDAVMSAKIDRIAEITGKILAYQKTHPNRESQLRTFLNY